MKKANEYKIQKRKDNRFSVQIMQNGKSYCIYGKTKGEVREKLAKKIEQLQEASLNKIDYVSSQTELIDWANLCLETYSKPNVRGNTYASYLTIIKCHLSGIGEKKLCEITNIMIQNHLNNLRSFDGKRRLNSSMIKNVRNFLSLVFNYAIQNNIIIRNPVQGIQIPKAIPLI